MVPVCDYLGMGNGIYPASKGKDRSKIISIIEGSMESIIAAMIEQAQDGNVAAATYLIDRVYGRPAQAINLGVDEDHPLPSFSLHIDGHQLFAADLVERLSPPTPPPTQSAPGEDEDEVAPAECKPVACPVQAKASKDRSRERRLL